MKVKPHHYRDFNAYVDFNFCINSKGTASPTYWCPSPYPLLEKGDVDPVQLFAQYESTGKMNGLPTEPKFLKMALDGKKILNWHIEQWAEGIVEGTFIAWEFRELLFALPDWVCESLDKQVYKLMKR